MSKDVETTVNVLSQTVSAWAEKVTRLGGRLDDLEASVGRLRAWADAHEDEREAVIRANAAKPSPMDERRKVVEEREIWTRLGDQLAALGLPTFRRVEKERDEAQKHLAEVTANLAATQAEAERLKELLAEVTAARPLEGVAKGVLMAEVGELAREDRESERRVKERSFEANEHLKKQIEDLQVALVKAREDLAEARKGTPGVQDQFRLEKLGRLFDSLFAHEADLTDETWEFWLSLETAGWLRPSRAQRFHSDMVERIQYLENAAGDQRERVRELMQQAAEASEQARQARIAEDIQRVEKEKAFELLREAQQAVQHAVCPHCHKCATCGTA